jgi:hypothetical protein
VNESKVLIPLNRSREGATGLVAFDVEVIYYEKSVEFGSFGSRATVFPVPDVIMSQMLWSVYLPVGYSYIHFDGTVEKEKEAAGLIALLGAKREINTYNSPAWTRPGSEQVYQVRRQKELSRLKGQFSANLALQEEQLANQIDNEMRFSQRVQELQTGAAPATAGVLPIRINIPTTGHIYRFAKTIVSEEPMTLQVTFVSDGTVWLVRAFLIGLALLVLFRLRLRIKSLYAALRSRIKPGYMPVLLLVAAFLLWDISAMLSAGCFLAAMAAAVWALVVWRRSRRETPETESAPSAD